jgi:hypothetical protein
VRPSDAVAVFLDFVTNPADDSVAAMPKVAVQVWAEALRDPDIHLLAREKMAALRDAMESVVLRCRRDGTLPSDIDPHEAAQVLFGLLPGFVLQRVVLEDVTPASYVRGVRALVG